MAFLKIIEVEVNLKKTAKVLQSGQKDTIRSGLVLVGLFNFIRTDHTFWMWGERKFIAQLITTANYQVDLNRGKRELLIIAEEGWHPLMQGW